MKTLYLILMLLSISCMVYSQTNNKCAEKYMEWEKKYGDAYINWVSLPSVIEMDRSFNSITYTDSAKKAKVEGKVIVRFFVGIDGKANCLKLIKGLGYGLDSLVMDAIRYAKFKPAEHNGKKKETPMIIPFKFGLDEKKNVSRFAVEVELGPVWQSRNDVQVPNDANSTRFSLIGLQGNGPYPAARLYLSWNINKRHRLRLLAAPLSITKEDVVESPTEFSGKDFNKGVQTEATYKFNSWRITYNYRFYQNQRFTWRIGFTAKIRDARIELGQGGKSAQKTDVGFVPLLNLIGKYRISEKWQFLLDVDALAGGPGRAEDASLKICYKLSPNWKLKAGYRTLEGGADVEEVYAFAWFHYAVLSTELSF